MDINSLNLITLELLSKCHAAGYTRVAIGVQDEEIPRAKDWPFQFYDSIFCFPEVPYIEKYPALWSILEEMNIHGCTGNGHQHQFDTENIYLTPGIYSLETIFEKQLTHA